MNPPNPPAPSDPPRSGDVGESTPPLPDEHADYLWDRSGPVDPDVARLEAMLAARGLRAGSLRAEPVAPTYDSPHAGASGGWRSRRPVLALAAVLGLVLTLGIVFSSRARSGWEVESISGAPVAAGRALRPGRVLAVEEWLETDAASSAKVRVPRIGTLDVSPNSRLRIEATSPNRHLVDLAHGHIHAFITAPERIFFVRTRAAMAIDMGCRYDLTMPESGPGLLTVITGWVILEGLANSAGDPYEARVPYGVSCVIHEDAGPGTPCRADNDQLARLLARPDARGWKRISRPDLEHLLSVCTPGDGVTLWHLLFRVQAAERTRVLARLRELVPVPAAVSDDAVMRLDQDAMEDLWSFVTINR